MLNSRSNIALACALSALAGYVDGIGFIHLGGLFVSFMSGNSTRLGVSLADGDWLNSLEALGLIAVFVVGAAVGSLIVRSRSPYCQAAILFVEGVLLCAAVAFHHLGMSGVAIAVIVVAMGLENTVFQIDGSSGLGLTYMTGALVKVGQFVAVALTGGDRWAWIPNLLLWAALVAGAVLGALAYHRNGLDAIWFAAALALTLGAILTVATARAARRDARLNARLDAPLGD